MRNVIPALLLAFVAPGQARKLTLKHIDGVQGFTHARLSMDKLVNKLVDRFFAKSVLSSPRCPSLQTLIPCRTSPRSNTVASPWTSRLSHGMQLRWTATPSRNVQSYAEGDANPMRLLVGLADGFRTAWKEIDDMPNSEEAILFQNAIKPGSQKTTGEILKLAGNYYGKFPPFKYFSKESLQTFQEFFRKNSAATVNIVNVAILFSIFRTLLPRLFAAAEGTGDLNDVAGALGLPSWEEVNTGLETSGLPPLPSREELAAYLRGLQELPLPTKVATFFAIFAVEKIFLLSDFLPFTVVLPAIAPAVFGNFIAGCLVSVGASTAGGALNFALGERVFSKRVEDFRWRENPPIKDSGWYKAIQKATTKDPFKIALLLRLAPILPIPIDGHWYLLGVLKMDYAKFLAGYALGGLKPVVVDAYFGSLLTDSLLGAPVQQQSGVVILAECAFILTAAAVSTTFATSTLNDVLSAGNSTSNSSTS